MSKYTTSGAADAGTLSGAIQWKDDELLKVIRYMQLTVAFLDGKGAKWSLATNPLRQDLERFKEMARGRGLKCQ